jgi:L-rhamnose isomerase
MSKIIDVFGEYEPTIRCACIDKRTLTNLNHSLGILYSDKMREQKELKEIQDPSSIENDAMNINDLVMIRTKSLMEVLKGIEYCKDTK